MEINNYVKEEEDKGTSVSLKIDHRYKLREWRWMEAG